MKLEVLQERKNALLGNRREVEFAVVADNATPSRKELLDAASKKLGVPADCVSIQKISQGFGSKKSKMLVHAYPSPDALAKAEPAHLSRRGMPKEEKKAA